MRKGKDIVIEDSQNDILTDNKKWHEYSLNDWVRVTEFRNGHKEPTK